MVCRYFIYGMYTEQNLERVMLDFEKFQIPSLEPDRCNDGYLKVRSQFCAVNGSMREM